MTKYSPPSGEASCTLSGRSLWREGRSNNSTMFNVQERIGSQRSIMELKRIEQEEEGMIGTGDFRGFHFENPQSKYRALISRIKSG